jgi:hypothetical protein
VIKGRERDRDDERERREEREGPQNTRAGNLNSRSGSFSTLLGGGGFKKLRVGSKGKKNKTPGQWVRWEGCDGPLLVDGNPRSGKHFVFGLGHAGRRNKQSIGGPAEGRETVASGGLWWVSIAR